ncbi:hypothetical protein SLS60_002550 [Paraconiothyrium brasiliense]|uniref:Uncharacterized protein n=1 Tax=Paraconiothyrium brasiliense TaxID=300254 RepID=A0ABR3RT50_9PLEO
MFPRAPPPGCGPEEFSMVEFNDGPTTSGDAGIGAEFETFYIQFTHDTCSLEDTFAAKRKTIRGRSGTNFVLSVDTSVEQGKGKVSAEYVLDGRNIRVGENEAAAAGKAAHDDLASWTPWSENPKDQVIIENYPQCPDPWIVRNLDENTIKDEIYWAPQVTTSMPLEALYFLMEENVRLGDEEANRNILNGNTGGRGQNIQLVTKDYFQALLTNLKLDKGDLNDAVLGFCTLILSYAKAANKPVKETDANAREMSPKSWVPFMPRTEFVKIYSTVKSQKFFEASDKLFDIFNTLACYKTTWKKERNEFDTQIDSEYCTGTNDKPVPGDKFGGLQYRYIGAYAKEGVATTLSIKEWIEGIGSGSPTPDLLTTFDTQYDGSIGGLGTQVEKMFIKKEDLESIPPDQNAPGQKTPPRIVPLFEFRDLVPQKTKDFETFMGDVDQAIQKLHLDFAKRPFKKVRRNDAGACQLSAATSPTTTSAPTTSPPMTPAPAMPSCSLQNEDPDQGINARGCVCGSTTLPLLTISDATDNSQSCSYTAMPTSSVANPVTIESQVYTVNCYLCTLIGGIADTPSCATTAVNGCTPTTTNPTIPAATVFLSNNSVPIGDRNNKNSGADLRSSLFTKLKALCPDNMDICDSKTPGEFDHVETVVSDEPMEETIKFTIQDSHYESTRERDQMIAAAVATWEQAVSKSCKEVNYKDYEDLTTSGCGDGIVKRGTVERALMTKEQRKQNPRYALPDPVCDDCSPPPPPECHYKATICSGPDHITPILGNTRNGPYANHMNIQLSYEIGGDAAFNEFICEVVIDGLTALAMAVAPELAGAELWEDLELQAVCEGLAEEIGSRSANITDNALLIGYR